MMVLRSIVTSALLISVVLTATGARQFNGTSQYLNAAVGMSLPITLSAWVYLDSASAASAAGSVGSAGNTRCHFGISSGGVPVATSATTSGTSGNAIGPSGLSTATWYCLTATFASTTERKIYVDGVPQATNTTSINVGTLDRTTIGMRVAASAAGLFWPGRIAEFAVWNATLTDAEIASLAAGAKPIRVRPASLRVYVPLPGEVSPEINFIGTAATLTNAPTAIAHPRVY